MRRTSVFLLLIATGFGGRAQQTGSVIRSETRLVQVEATVTDKKGNPVRGLTQKDFKVFEDNREQAITAYSAESGAQDRALQDRNAQHIVLFFDNSTAGAAQAFARQAAAKFIDAGASPKRMIAIADFSASLTMTQNFTADPVLLKKAVGGTRLTGAATAPSLGAAKASQDSYAANTALGALQTLAKGLASVPGRKAIILVSSGFSDAADARAGIAATINACNRANVAIYPVSSSLTEMLAVEATGGTSDSAPATGLGGRRNALRNGDSLDDSASGTQQSLLALANGTGGFLTTNTGDLLKAFEKVGREQQEFYLLGYAPSKESPAGTCHVLRVRVENPNVAVRSRAGYCDAAAQEVPAVPSGADLEARLNGGAAVTVTGAMMQAPHFYTAADAARVHLALQLPPGAIQFAKDKGKYRAEVNIIGIATLPDGTVRSRFSDTLPLEFDEKQQADDATLRPFQYEKQFAMVPGAYTLKVAFSSGADRFGKLEMPLNVEAWSPAKFLLSGLSLSAVVRSTKGAAAGGEERVQLVANGFEIMPFGASRFQKSRKAYLYAEVYEPAMAQAGMKPEEIPAVGVRMELLEAVTGKVKKDFGLTRLRIPPLTGSAAIPMGLVITAPELEAGDYKLRLSALDATGRQAVRIVDIHLEN